VPDACDICPNSYRDDTDGDTICDDIDICMGDAVLDGTGDDRVDMDGDGIPDDCDICPIDPLNDSDGDGVCGDVNGDDVCP